MAELIVPAGYGEIEYIEKRSQFIGRVWYAETEAEATARIKEMREKHWDASHNVYAYSIKNGGIARFSDDGEPSGTSGMPVMNVFRSADVDNFCCVVTRYFGGTLLGTGGLVRAYTAAVKAALENAEIIEVIRGTELVIRVTYPQAGRLQYVFARENLPVCEIEYGQDVIMHQFVPRQDVRRIRKLVIENTDGKAEFIEEIDKEYTLQSRS